MHLSFPEGEVVGDDSVVLGSIGDSLEIDCMIGVPTLGEMRFSQNVTWFYLGSSGGKPALLGEVISNFETRDNDLLWEGVLTLKQFAADNEGTYICQAVTPFGQFIVHQTKVIKPG